MDEELYKDDAWYKHHELLKEFTSRWDPRSDISVIAHGADRSVELILWGEEVPMKMRKYTSTGKRNVATLRETALCILAACDAVEEANPQWADNGINFESDVSKFESSDD